MKKYRLNSVTAATLISCALAVAAAQTGPPPTPVAKTAEQLQQLVAPIALYPDELAAEVLAATTEPAQVVVADRWLQNHNGLQGKQLADEVDEQPWDSSVKALTQFPSVLTNMDNNLLWTSSLGDAYMNQPEDVMETVQVMRQRAQQAGYLTTNSQQEVSQQDNAIVIEPTSPDIVYVPTYDPWTVYGQTVAVYPGWYSYPGAYVSGGDVSFVVGVEVGSYWGYGWGWHHWGCDWHDHYTTHNHNHYYSHSSYTHASYTRGGYTHASYSHSGFDRGNYSRVSGSANSNNYSHSSSSENTGNSASRGYTQVSTTQSKQSESHSGVSRSPDHGVWARRPPIR